MAVSILRETRWLLVFELLGRLKVASDEIKMRTTPIKSIEQPFRSSSNSKSCRN